MDPDAGIRRGLAAGSISYSDLGEVPVGADVDGIVVVSPASTHTKVVSTALDRGWATLVEKPFTTELADAIALRHRALSERVAVYPGQVYAHSGPAIEFARQVRRPEFGELRQVLSSRLGLGLVRTDVSVLADLLPHDLMLLEMMGAPETQQVLSVTTQFLGTGHPETAAVTLFHGPAAFAQIELSWAHPTKVRTTSAIGARRMATFDDTNAAEPLKVFDRRLVREAGADGRSPRWVPTEGPTTTPGAPTVEPLRAMLDEFLSTIGAPERARPALDRAIRFGSILEASERSAKAGRPEPIRPAGGSAR